MSPTRPFYWSVWRELWENRSIYIAPLIVAAVILFGSFVGAFHLAGLRRNALLLDPAHRRAAIEMPYNIAAMMMIFTAFIVGVFYCLDALQGERRDRSILFWKSLPVSDLTDSARESEHSAGGSAAGHIRRHCRHTVHNAAHQHCGPAAERSCVTTWETSPTFNSR